MESKNFKYQSDHRKAQMKSIQDQAKKKTQDMEISFFNLGMEGVITAFLVVDDPFGPDQAEDEFLLLVGTNTGDVYLSDILSKKSMGIVYNIPPRGENPLTNKKLKAGDALMDEEDMQIYKQSGILEMGSLSTTSLWIQFRGGMLGLYSWDLHSNKYRLILEKRFVLNHPGFCRGLYDAPHERFIMPDKLAGGSTGFCMIDDHENKTIYDLSSEILRQQCKRPLDVDNQTPFSGAVFFIQPYHWNNANHYFVGFEDASLMLYDVRNGIIIEWFKRVVESPNSEDRPAMLSIDSRPVLTIDKLEARQFVISEPTCVYVVYYDPIIQKFNVTNTLKELKNDNHCTTISFGPETTKRGALPRREPVRLVLGYNFSLIEFYSVYYNPEAEAYIVKLVSMSTVPNSEDNKLSVINRLGWSHRWNMLFAGTDDGRVIHYDHIQLEKSRKPRY